MVYSVKIGWYEMGLDLYTDGLQESGKILKEKQTEKETIKLQKETNKQREKITT